VRNWGFEAKLQKRLKIQISRKWARAQPYWARAYVPTTALNLLRCAAKESSSQVSSNSPLLSSSAHALNSHQRTKMHLRPVIQLEWARAHSCWAWAHSAELKKMQTRTITPIRQFLMPKTPVSLVFATGQVAFVFCLSFAREANHREG
jgi:hypothetical protein